MPYIEYPKALSHKKHGHKTVHNKEQEDAARSEGWATHGEIEAQKADAADAETQSAGTDAKSVPSATELAGAPLSVDPSDVDDRSAGIIDDAADSETEEDTSDSTDAAERKRKSSGGGKHKK